ncbi:hypothetical protein [Nocardioides sp. J9]|uniref:hypothetical protein n=1 Tax=Nocardioides sp. J9 TaxID=935844 RepID=UPI0011A28434|nr:hypothetical protein [Nocardioides sp. J9]
MSDTPYAATARRGIPSADELRARIPGWGADLDPADRPSYPREVDGRSTRVPWDLPEQQPEPQPRERSIEHARLTPVFGTSVPLRGLSGAVRRLAYRRFSEARAAHWLLLLGADRIDVVEQTAVALVRGRPDNPVTETGIRAEITRDGLASRVGRGRLDVRHQALDPVVVALPWALGAWAAVRGARAVRRAVRSS